MKRRKAWTEAEVRAMWEMVINEGKTLKETGKSFGISRERARQLIYRIFRKTGRPSADYRIPRLRKEYQIHIEVEGI